MEQTVPNDTQADIPNLGWTDQSLHHFIKVQNLLTTDFVDFAALADQCLIAGKEILVAETGFITKLEGEKHVIVAVKDDNAELKIENEIELSEDFFNRLCFPIHVNDRLYGSLQFWSNSTGFNKYTVEEKELVVSLANVLGYYLYREEQEMATKNYNDRLRKLIGYVAHDLRNPLNNITMLTQFIEDDKLSSLLETSAEKGLDIIDKILTSAAMDRGKIKIQRENTDLSELVKNVGSGYAMMGKERDLKFDFQLENEAECSFDKNRMEQVLTNIYSNTIKYTPRKGLVRTSLTKCTEGLKLVVSNQKMISPNFGDKFNNNRRSIGFGHEIIREILNLHGAEFSIDEDKTQYAVSFVLPVS